MAEIEMKIPATQYVGKFCRRRPWLSATVFILIFLTFVPVWPYTPTCDPHPGKTIQVEGEMSPDYRYSLKAHFEMFGVYYWEIGDIILIRLLPFMDGDELFPQNDAILNANDNAALALASKPYVRSFVGETINGKVYHVPEFIEALRNLKTGRFNTGLCSFMVPVVTGKPVAEFPSKNITN